MTAEQFVYWLQGALELGTVTTLDSIQVQIIQDHLDLVLKKETPVRQKLAGLPPVPDNAPTIVEKPYQMPRLGVAPVPPMFGPNEVPTLTC